MRHSTIVLLCLQCCSLVDWMKKWRVYCDIITYDLFLLRFTADIELSECCVWFQCIAQWCCSCFSNLVVCLIWWKKKSRLWIISLVLCFFYAHSQDRASWVLCLISKHHSMMLHLFLQSYCLFDLMWLEKSGLSVDTTCVLLLLLTIHTKLSKCCVYFQCVKQCFQSCISNHTP